MKKFLAFLLLTAMVFPVTGCDLDEILTASNPLSVSENSFSTTNEKYYDLPSDISSDSVEESDFPEESESSSSVSSSSFVYPDEPSDSSEISTTMTEPEESVESTISTFPDESSYSSSPLSKSSTTLSSASKPSSTTTKSSTSKPDFPGSDYQAYLDGTMVVYIAASGNGKKYHIDVTCSNMNGNVIKMTKKEAEGRGYGPCQRSKCFGHYF
ncbi:MAG: hypothetical protein J1F09_06635 [Oscillospiraceae bacterium]|nr:hypothetical protein [Oscillospiraceae bacterium]